MVGAWRGEVLIELTVEPFLSPATPRASKGIPSFFQGLSEWGLALVRPHMAETLGAKGTY